MDLSSPQSCPHRDPFEQFIDLVCTRVPIQTATDTVDIPTCGASDPLTDDTAVVLHTAGRVVCRSDRGSILLSYEVGGPIGDINRRSHSMAAGQRGKH